MITLSATQASRDLYLDRFGNLSTSSDEDAMAEYMTQRLSSLVGEFNFDKQRGIPYMTTVYTQGAAGIPALRASILDAISSSENVVGIAYLNMSLEGSVDNLRFEVSIATPYGRIAVRV